MPFWLQSVNKPLLLLGKHCLLAGFRISFVFSTHFPLHPGVSIIMCRCLQCDKFFMSAVEVYDPVAAMGAQVPMVGDVGVRHAIGLDVGFL